MSILSELRWHYEQQGLTGILSTFAEDPSRALEVVRSQPDHFYHLELPVYREDALTFVRPLVGAPDDTILETWREIGDGVLTDGLEAELARTAERPDTLHSNWRELLYTLVRLKQPDVVVETGIFDGLSSAYILHALDRNGTGQLISIDIDDPSPLPDDLSDVHAGWIVPDSKRDRWTRKFGDSKDILPTVVEEHSVDCFLHDSLHTTEHMQFEFGVAIEAMDGGGLFLSDNVRFNEVFWTLARPNLRTPVFWKNTSISNTHDNTEVDDRIGAGLVTGE